MFAFAIVTTRDSSRTALIYPLVLFCFLTYLSFRAGLAWIRILDNGAVIVTVPCWYARRLFGEKGRTVKVTPESELVISRRTAYGALDGYYVTLRAKNGSEEVLWNSINGIGRRRRARIVRDLEGRFGLDVLQVKQDRTPGAHSETEWNTTFDKGQWKNAGLALVPGFMPFLGVPVRLLTGDVRILVLMGFVLWFLGAAAYWVVFRLSRTRGISKDQNLPLTLFVWTMTYIPFYIIAVVGTRVLILKQ